MDLSIWVRTFPKILWGFFKYCISFHFSRYPLIPSPNKSYSVRARAILKIPRTESRIFTAEHHPNGICKSFCTSLFKSTAELCILAKENRYLVHTGGPLSPGGPGMPSLPLIPGGP